MNEFYEDMFSENLATYKLTDSSYIVAEELEVDPETGSIYVANPLEMIRENGGMRLRPWILVDTDEIVELNALNIMCRTEAPKVISKYYLKYIAYDKLIDNIQKLDDEDDLDTDDELDNLDSTYNFFDKLNSPTNSRWDWKAN